MRKTTLLLACLAIALFVSTTAFAVQNVTPQQAYDMVVQGQTVYILDVRTEAEWKWVGHPGMNLLYEGAGLQGKVVNISYKIDKKGAFIVNPSFLSDVSEIFAPSTPLITMCKSGARGLAAAQLLELNGFTNVSNMVGGFEGKNDAFGYPTGPGWKTLGLPYSYANPGYGD